MLWADRFKSVLLEGGEALAAVAAYIELNPVRAGLCTDPKDYRYCVFAEALAKGSSLARQGIRMVLGQSETISWKEVSRQLSGCTKLGDLENKGKRHTIRTYSSHGFLLNCFNDWKPRSPWAEATKWRGGQAAGA